ncbi:MAG TPA: VWA domain-containing protein [Gemmatimonadales bacterium]
MITFAAPWALLGLLAAAVPILIHLLARREPPVVDFPAVRYLSDTARIHQRRLALRNWLLLLVRTLLVVVLVLAAAGPTWPRAGAGGHAPSALALVLDNSLSAGATGGGTLMMERLRAVALGVLDRAGPADALWLVTAEGGARRGDRAALRAAVDSVAVSPRHLDLGHAITLATGILANQDLPGEILLLTDLQATALSGTSGRPSARRPVRPSSITIARPTDPAPRNAGVARVELGVLPWTAGAGRVTVHLASSDTAGIPLAVTTGTRPPRQALAALERPATTAVTGLLAGWVPVMIELAPDELPLDDRHLTAVRVASPARVRWEGAGRFLATAAEVLREGGRVQPGTDITVGALGAGASVVLPPDDAALVGAVNRDLQARGIPWRFGPREAGQVTTDSGAMVGRQRVSLRHRLEPAASGTTGILATAGGAPWLVRSGNVVLLASRLDTAWTDLPLAAGFLPFLDALLNVVVPGELAVINAAPGDPVTLPDRAEVIASADGELRVEGGAVWRPGRVGLHFVRAGRDTIGLVAVNSDPRESRLRRADDGDVRALWSEVRIVDLEDAPAAAFSAGARGDLRLPLLMLALGLGVVEATLAGWRRKAP